MQSQPWQILLLVGTDSFGLGGHGLTVVQQGQRCSGVVPHFFMFCGTNSTYLYQKLKYLHRLKKKLK
jgi:hypothetical protein